MMPKILTGLDEPRLFVASVSDEAPRSRDRDEETNHLVSGRTD